MLGRSGAPDMCTYKRARGRHSTLDGHSSISPKRTCTGGSSGKQRHTFGLKRFEKVKEQRI